MALSKIDAANFLTGTIPSGNVATSSLPAGSVIQAVTFTYSTQESTSSTSFVASSVTASITPSSSSNKVLVMVSGTQTTSGNASHNVATIYRGSSTKLGDRNYGISYASTSGGSAHSGISMNVLDSPSTTSATSYTMYFKETAAHSQTLQNGGAKSTIVLLEIAG